MIKIHNLNLYTDFDYRVIRENENDLDLFVDINYRSLDLEINDSYFINSRIQFPFVRSLILRLNKSNNLMTIHLMRDIDLFSAFANFEIDYTNSLISIKNNLEKVCLSKSSL